MSPSVEVFVKRALKVIPALVLSIALLSSASSPKAKSLAYRAPGGLASTLGEPTCSQSFSADYHALFNAVLAMRTQSQILDFDEELGAFASKYAGISCYDSFFQRVLVTSDTFTQFRKIVVDGLDANPPANYLEPVL